jgi:Tubulin-tyrosine ligase family
VHLTNDAIQKKAEDYGKFECGNKISYSDFQHYLDKQHADKSISFDRDIIPQFKRMTQDCMKAVWGKIDPYKRVNTFEVFGLDFMLDDQFKPYLIEVNTNPCLEMACPLLARLIPTMLENAFRILVDPMFPPPEGFSQKKQVVQELTPECKFQLIFDERLDAPQLLEVFKQKADVIVEIDEDEISDEEIIDE